MKKQRTEEEIKAHIAVGKRYIAQLSNEIVQLEAQLKSRQPQPIKITHHIELEVKPTDEPELMTWHEAMAKFGPDGTDKEWRLPTHIELAIMVNYKHSICVAQNYFYWSSTESNYYYACNQRFSDGYQYTYNKNNNNLVRCVRR